MATILHQWSALWSGLPHRALGLGSWLVAVGILFGVLERWRPIKPQPFLRDSMLQDVGYYFLGGLLPPFLTVIAVAGVAWFTSGFIPAGFYGWVGSLPLWLRVAALVVIGDLAFYWAHRWSHEVQWLWHFHAIHHSPTELDWLVNTRAHPLDLVFARVVSAIPILVLGLRQPGGDIESVIALYVAVTTVWAFFVHTNLKWRLGWLEQVIVTPAFHHWHHADDAPGSLNKNYASLFPWLDRLFGTHHLPADSLPPSYGANRELPPSLAGQLISPFVRDDAFSRTSNRGRVRQPARH
jgi:sterol desaturase/sphingolipid hydroxylase (fatty acid hydroxylase superfamily)